MNVDVDVYGNKLAAVRLTEIGSRAIDMRPVFTVIRELLIEGHQRQFETQGAFLGTPWPKLAPATLARKARMGQPATPMVATGDLSESLSGGKGRRTRVGRSSVSVGTSLFYAVFHIKGAKGKGSHSAGSRSGRRGVMPARPPMGISEGERATALTLVERYLMEGARL